MYQQAVQLVHVNNTLFKLSENWTVKPTSGWPYERKEISCAEVINECLDKTESICSEYPHAVHEAFKPIRLWYLKSFEAIGTVSGTDKQVREAALLTILFSKANKFQSEKQYNTMTVPGLSLDSAPDNPATSLDEDATVSSLGNESSSHSSIPKKRATRSTGTNKTKLKKAKTHHSDKWKQLIPDDKGEQQDIRSMSPSKWPHLPQLGNRRAKGHTCALCYTKGHHPKYCPNVAWAIMYGAIKKFIPSGVRNHVAEQRG